MKLRRAAMTDALDVLAWRNDPLAIAMSRTPDAVESAKHLSWFKSAIEDPDRLILIAEDGARKIGMVRFDRMRDDWRISINIAPEERGKGYGQASLREAIIAFRAAIGPGRIVAESKTTNVASLHLFKQCGFVELERTSEYCQLALD
jgi:RimJ/RimL family protein N-acetyltransferase